MTGSDDITELLEQAAEGNVDVTDQLFPLVYEELRAVARGMMKRERAGHSLQPTALVHETFMRLVKNETNNEWNGRNHFFAAAAESMRRILIEHARQKLGKLRGGHLRREDFEWTIENAVTGKEMEPGWLIELDDALEALAKNDPSSAELVKLKLFAGLSVTEAAQFIGISKSKAYGHWAYARAMLAETLGDGID